MATLLTWLRDFRDLLSPRLCAICGRRLATTERHLCAACLMSLPYLPTRDFYDNEVCRLFWAKAPIVRGHSYIRYRRDSESHRLLLQLKYNHQPYLGIAMGRMMAHDLQPLHFFEGVEAIIAIPLHWRRQWARGYNPSLQLARGISEVVGLPVLRRAVVRLRNNPSQTHKTARERMENVEDIFAVRKPIAYSHVLLIDDVLTTGATLAACAQAIASARPGVRISILTLAKA